MSTSDISRTTAGSFAAFVASIEAAANPDQALLEHIIAQAREKNVELAEAIRYCAIPRRFDAQVIGVIRGAPDDQQRNEQLLSDLKAYSFVLAREDNSYVYHDNTRDTLLEIWQTDESRRAQFDQYNQRLIDFYKDEHKQAAGLERDLTRVGDVIREVSRERFAQLATMIEARIVTPLAHALYHAALQSPARAKSLFEEYVYEYEAAARLGVCESLVASISDSLSKLPPDRDAAPALRWTRYWDARLARDRGQPEEAEHLLRALLPETDSDTTLKLWSLGELGLALHNQAKLVEARIQFEGRLALAEGSKIDPYNLPVAYTNLADVHSTLGEYERMAERYRQATAAAEQHDNPRVSVQSLIGLSTALLSLGRWSEALDVALAGLHKARTCLALNEQDHQFIHQDLAEHFMELFARRAPQLLDTLYAEAKVLLSKKSDALCMLHLDLIYSNLLVASGQLARAEAALGRVKAQLEQSSASTPNLELELLKTEISLRKALGRQGEAVQLYTQILERAPASPAANWYAAVALADRGRDLGVEQAEWKAAERDLSEALDQLQAMNLQHHVMFTRIHLAALAHRQGKLADAQKSLDAVRTAVEEVYKGCLCYYLHVQADLDRHQGRWPEAYEHYQQALGQYRAFQEWKTAAQVSSDLTRVANAQGQWAKAARHAQEALDLWTQVAELGNYRPTDENRLADEDYAEAILRLAQADADSDDKAKEQVHALLASPARRIPDHPWYQLSLAYVAAECELWQEAAEAIATILAAGPDWFRRPMLYEHLAEYRFKHASQLYARHDYATAGAAYNRALSELDRYLPFDHLAEGWLQLGNSWKELGSLDLAKAAYLEGLVRALKADHADEVVKFRWHLADLHVRTGYRAFEQSKLEGARQDFERALRLYRENDEPEPGVRLADICRSLLTGVEQYWRLVELLQAWSALPDLKPMLRTEVAKAIRSIEKYLDHLYNLTVADERMPTNLPLPVVTPIILEVGKDLVPKVDSRQDNGKFLYEDIPAMRERIFRDTGVRITGVRARAWPGNPLAKASMYAIQLDEVPVASRTVEVGKLYCLAPAEVLQSLGIPVETQQPTHHPRTGQPGFWLSPNEQERLQAHGLELWTETAFIICHLETMLRRNLARFLGFQEVQSLLEVPGLEPLSLSAEVRERVAGLVPTVLPDLAARIRFSRVLRSLVGDGVSIAGLDEILAAFADSQRAGDNLGQTVQAIRQRIRQRLPGNAGSAQRLELPAEWETALATWHSPADSAADTVIPTADLDRLFAWIRASLPPPGQDTVLVTRDSSLRPFLRHLVRQAFPDLHVLSQDEVLPDEERMPG